MRGKSVRWFKGIARALDSSAVGLEFSQSKTSKVWRLKRTRKVLGPNGIQNSKVQNMVSVVRTFLVLCFSLPYVCT